VIVWLLIQSWNLGVVNVRDSLEISGHNGISNTLSSLNLVVLLVVNKDVLNVVLSQDEVKNVSFGGAHLRSILVGRGNLLKAAKIWLGLSNSVLR